MKTSMEFTKDLLLQNKLARWISPTVMAVGVFLFLRLAYGAISGSLIAEYYDHLHAGTKPMLYLLLSLALALPVPLHVISIGLILRRKLLSPIWAKLAWFSIVISGCWLGVSLVIRQFMLG